MRGLLALVALFPLVAAAQVTNLTPSPLTQANLPSATTSQLYGGTGVAGTAQAITLGTNLSISGTTLNATGGGGSGAVTLISTQTASDTASLGWTGLSTSTYYQFKLYCEDLTSSGSSSDSLLIQFGYGSTSWLSSSYMGSYFGNSSNTTTVSGAASSSSGVSTNAQIGVAPVGGYGSMMLNADISLLNSGTPGAFGGQVTGSVVSLSSAGYSYYTQFSGGYAGPHASSVNAIQVVLTSGDNIQNGQCSLYGLSH